MASLLDPPVSDSNSTSLLTAPGTAADSPSSWLDMLRSAPGMIGDFLADQGRQIGDQSLRTAGYDPDTVRFQQGLLAEHPEMRLPQTPAPPGAGTSDPYVPTMNPEAAVSAANRQFAGNLGMMVGSTFEGGPRDLPLPQGGALSVPTNNPLMVSTRIPYNKGLDYDPHQANDAIINQAAMMADPKTPSSFDKNMSLLAGGGYPAGVPPNLGSDPQSIASGMRDLWTGNIKYIQSMIPQDVQDFSRDWYRSANAWTRQLSDQYGVSPQASAGVTAVLSPKYDWNQNADLAHRVINIWTQHQDTPASSDMASAAQRMWPDEDMSWLRPGSTLAEQQGDPRQAGQFIRAFDETNNPSSYRMQSPVPGQLLDTNVNQDGTPSKLAWQQADAVTKAVNILQDDSIPNISQNLGGAHKVRNFYNNIVDPDNTRGDVTVDTHQIAGNLLLPIGQKSPLVEQGLGSGGGASSSAATGAKGLYGLQADATRQAADGGLLPREAQSITWGGAKSLFEGQKSATNLALARDIWQNYSAGRISADDARNQIGDQFAPSGLALPPWYQGAKDQAAAPRLGSVSPERMGGGAGGAAAGAPAGLAAPDGGAGVPAGVGSLDLSGIRAATRLIPPPGYAQGGLIDGPPTGAYPVTGFVPPSASPNGDTDGLTVPLPKGGYVLPADTVSLLGNGSPLQGARHLDNRLPPRGPLAQAATLGRVAGGEYVVDPEQLRGLDDDRDPAGGFSLLHDMVGRGQRGHSPRTLRGLLAP